MSVRPLAPTPWSDGVDGGSDRDAPGADSAAWLQSARREARAGNALAARHMYSCAVAATPGGDAAVDGRVWLAWAKLEARAGVKGGAFEEVMERATFALPDDPYLWHFWGRTLLRKGGGNRAAARKVLRRGKDACLESAALRCELAALEAGAGNTETARKMYREALEADPSDSHAYMDFAQLEQRCHRMRAARTVLAEGVKRVSKKDAAVLYTAFAKLEVREGHAEQARFLYMRGAEANPSDRYIWQTWAAFEASNGHAERARQLFERGIVVTGGAVASIWQAWGVLEQRQGRLQEARHLFSRGTRANPSDAATWAAWGRLEVSADNKVEARRLFQHASDRVGPESQAGALFLSWAMFEADQGNDEEACGLLRTAIDRRNDSRDDSVRLLHAWATLEWRANRTAKARALFGRALRLNPEDPRTAHSLARLEIASEQFVRARTLLSRAHRTSPSDTHIVASLALLEWQHFGEDGGIARARHLFSSGARTAANDATLIRAWASFETAQGDVALGNRLRSVANKRPTNRRKASKPRART